MRPIQIPHVHDVQGVECPACAISPAARPMVIRGGGEVADLHVLVLADEAGADYPYGSLPVLSRWELTDEERAAIAIGAPIDIVQLTYGHSLQAIGVAVPGVEA